MSFAPEILKAGFRPNWGRVLVKCLNLADEGKSSGGIYFTPRPQGVIQAEILAVPDFADQEKRKPRLKLSPGNRVLIPAGSGLKFSDEKEELRVLAFKDILGRLEQ